MAKAVTSEASLYDRQLLPVSEIATRLLPAWKRLGAESVFFCGPCVREDRNGDLRWGDKQVGSRSLQPQNNRNKQKGNIHLKALTAIIFALVAVLAAVGCQTEEDRQRSRTTSSSSFSSSRSSSTVLSRSQADAALVVMYMNCSDRISVEAQGSCVIDAIWDDCRYHFEGSKVSQCANEMRDAARRASK